MREMALEMCEGSIVPQAWLVPVTVVKKQTMNWTNDMMLIFNYFKAC